MAYITNRKDIRVVTSNMTKKRRREATYVDDASLQISSYLIFTSSLLKSTDEQQEVLTDIPPGKFPPICIVSITTGI